MNIYFQYNPYTLESQFEVQEKEYVQEELDSYLQTKKERQLQSWIYELPTVMSDIINDDFTIIFNGTRNDFEDLESVVQTFNNQKNNKIKIKVEHQEVTESRERLKQLETIFSEIQRGPFEELKEENVINNFRRALEDEVEVAVIATMSSGKSTVINAMLGKDLMPTRNQATTASITRITYAPQEHYEARPISKEGEVLEEWREADLELMDAYNDAEHVSTTELRGPLRIQSRNGINIALIDTPGPNNSQDASHRKATFDFIKSKEMPLILYVLNATQLGIEDDATLLQALQREMDTSNMQAQERFIFAVNKIDALDPEKESIEHIIENAKNYLQKNGIENPRIFPITAKFAQLLRMDMNGEELSRRDMRTLRDHEYLEEDYNIVKHAMLSERERRVVESEIEELRARGEEQTVSLYYTGIPLLEKAIEAYFEKYALPFKVRTALSTFNDLLKGRVGEQKVLDELKDKIEQNDSIEEQFMIVRQVVEEAQSIDTEFVAEAQENMQQEFDGKLKKEFVRALSETQSLFYDDIFAEEDNLVEVDDFNPWLNHFTDVYKDIIIEVQSELENEMREQLEKLGNETIDDLKEKLRSIIGDEIEGLDDYLLADLGTVQIDNIIADITYDDFAKEKAVEIKEKVGTIFVKTSTWWKPWTWGDGYYKDIIRSRKVIASQDIIKNYQKPAIENLQFIRNEAQDILNNQLTALNNELERIFELTKEQLEEKEQELELLANQLDDSEREVEKRQASYEWLKQINSQLDQVIQL